MKTVFLGDLCEINPKVDVNLQDDSLCSFIPMDYIEETFGTIRKTDIRTVGEVKKGYTFFKNDDVLFAKITPCMENGKCAIARNLRNGIGFGSTEYHVVRSGNGVVPEWVYYFLRQDRIRYEAKEWFRGTAGQQRVPSDFLEQVKLFLPSPLEQQRIAAILAKSDRLRRLRRTARQLSDTYLQSVFLEMFGNFYENQRNYEFRLLEELAEVVSGVTKGQHYGNIETIEAPYLRVANVQDGYLDLSEIKTIRVPPSEAESLWLQKDDILMTEGGDFDKLGRGAIWNGQIPHCIHQNHIFRARLNQDLVNPYYFESFLLSGFGLFGILSGTRHIWGWYNW
jgi:type I restriction enzyme S subunit